MSERIRRITLFKLPVKTDQLQLIDAYKMLKEKCKKEDGTPYIQSLEVALVMKYRQTQGFTVMSKGEFASLEDMKYYDTKCKAHMALKETVKMLELQGGLAEGVMVINYSLDPPLLAAKGNDVSEAS